MLSGGDTRNGLGVARKFDDNGNFVEFYSAKAARRAVDNNSLIPNDAYPNAEGIKVSSNNYPIDGSNKQTWAVIVGNSETHGSFEDFKQVIRNSNCEASTERWVEKVIFTIPLIDVDVTGWVLEFGYAQTLRIDGKTIETSWGFSFDPYDFIPDILKPIIPEF